MILKFKRKIAGLLILLYLMIAILIVFILNFSYVRNQKDGISRILNMKFQMATLQSGDTPRKNQREESGKPKVQGQDKLTSDSYVNKSYLVIKNSEGKFYVENSGFYIDKSEKSLVKTAKCILETGGKSGVYDYYQYEITVGGDDLLIGFADISQIEKEEKKYLAITSILAFIGLGIWTYPAWKVAGHMVSPLEEAIELQNEFVMFAGHELKTPVTVMKASIDMLHKDGICSKYLDYIEQENEKMKKIIIELLDYSKLQFQKKEMKLEIVNLSECLESTALEFEVLAFEKGVRLSETIEDEIFIMGNAEKLQRMLATLVENAIRHTAETNEMRILLKKEEKKIHVSIENQGKEIPEKERAKIFEKFYQISGDETSHYGLGLAIAQMIARQHHTEIKVTCKEGWNRFEIEFLPLKNEEK